MLLQNYFPISVARSQAAVNQGPDPDVVYLRNWFVLAEGQTGLLYFHWELATLHHPRKWKKPVFGDQIHKKGRMIVPNPSSIPPNLPASDSKIQISPACGILTESSMYTREEEGNDASHT